MNYPCPCNSCKRHPGCSNVKVCEEYKKWIRTWWKWFNGRCRERKARAKYREFFQYEHPDHVRRYLQDGPCKGCQAAENCDTPCAAYLRWWDARMEVVRKKVECERIT